MEAGTCRKIYGMAKQLGINDGELHCLVHGVTGRVSIRELTDEQAREVIRELSVRLRTGTLPTDRSPASKKYTTKALNGMTREQCGKVWAQICELIRLDGQEYSSDEAYRRLSGAVKKITGCSMGTRKEPFYGLSSDDGRKLIDMLKRYIYSAEKKAARKGVGHD